MFLNQTSHLLNFFEPYRIRPIKGLPAIASRGGYTTTSSDQAQRKPIADLKAIDKTLISQIQPDWDHPKGVQFSTPSKNWSSNPIGGPVEV
jgi:hypothetical protein